MLHQLRSSAEKGEDGAVQELKNAAQLMGLLPLSESAWENATSVAAEIDEAEIKAAIAARLAARDNKDWAEADRIRDELLDKGIILKDGPEGTTYEVKR